MFYRVSQVLNITLSCLFILLGFYAVVTANDFPVPAIFALCFIFTAYPTFVWFTFICSKTHRCNTHHSLISKKLKTAGVILTVFTLLFSLLIIIFSIAAVAEFSAFFRPSVKSQWPFLFAFLLLFFMSGLTAIINIIFFSKSLKKNKTIVSEFINTIGAS
jgi:hypothetical protein